MALLVCLALTAGCTRKFYRTRADVEVSEVLSEKDHCPPWSLEEFHVYPDPRARYADPTNPDRPPMPPDDPAAHDMSPNPQKPGKAGISRVEGTGYLALLAGWDAENRQADAGEQGKLTLCSRGSDVPSPDSAASAQSSANTPRDATATESKNAQTDTTSPPHDPTTSPPNPPPYLVTIDQAVELGLINSREYQNRREALYLLALPVTLERFAFSAQFFLMEEMIRQASGRDSNATAPIEKSGASAPNSKTNQWIFNTGTGFSKLFSTGALLLFQFANQTIVNLTDPNLKHTISTSTINLDMVQPLLRGGGRAVTLEPLTQTERNLLYGVRDYAHFRKDFYVSIAGGRDLRGQDFSRTAVAVLAAASRAPIPTSPALTAVGFRGNRVEPGESTILGPVPPPEASPAGYLPTLLLSAELVNERANVTALEGFLRLFQALLGGGDLSPLQVDQVELQLLSGQSRVLQAEQNFHSSLDDLKIQLGLPTDLPLELDDSPVRPIAGQMNRFNTVIKDFDAARTAAMKYDSPDEARLLRPRLLRILTDSAMVRETRFSKEVTSKWERWQALSAAELTKLMEKYGAERRQMKVRQDELEAKGQKLSAEEQKRLTEIDFEIDLGSFERLLREYERQPWKRPGGDIEIARQQVEFRTLIEALGYLLGAARNERLARLDQTWPALPRVCLDGMDLIAADVDEAQTVVAQAALINRFDLMNQRAQVVDAWRQLAVSANALLGVFNVRYHFDTSTPPNEGKPFALGGSRSKHQLILNFDAPLVRQQEQNDYRGALIAYQRRRRELMADEDIVLENVRFDIRQLRLLAENYRIQKRAVELAYKQVEQAFDIFNQPPTPVGPAGGGNVAANSAALTSQLLSSQSNLLQTQNQMLSFWVSYLIARMVLYRDLEMMPVDSRGVWIDEIASCQCNPPCSDGKVNTSESYPGRTEGSARGDSSGHPERLPAPQSDSGPPRSPHE
jgi:hypothetical protein